MATDDIINQWKSRGRQAGDAPDAPEDPAGDVNLSDEDLDSVSGGAEPTVECTSPPSFCRGTCCFDGLGCCDDTVM